jgi:glycosyltransferase involved in cell wall biosynthesis
MMMKIALCKTTFAGPVSGADEALVNYAVHLREAGHDVRVVLLHRPPAHDPYYARARRAGFEVECIVKRSPVFAVLSVARRLLFGGLFFFLLMPNSPGRLRRVWEAALALVARLHYRHCRSYFAATRPDLLHVFTPDAGAALMIRAGHELGLPVLYHELGTPRYMPALEGYYRRLEKYLPLCAEVAALSPRLAAQWAERLPGVRRVSVLPLIVDAGDVRAPSVRKKETGETVFGYAARVEEGKGPLVLIEALAGLSRDEAPALLRLAGTGPQLPEARARVRALGLEEACEFVAPYTEPAGRDAFMRTLDVFILPSLAEGTPNAVVEAMAAGLPVIASEVGGIPDLLTSDSGIIVPPGDGAALAAAMRRLASDPALRASMGRAARERYLSLFSPAAVLPLIESTYRRVAGTHAPHPAHAPHPWEAVPEF